MRGLSNLRFFKTAPKPPPKDTPKPAISAPQNLRYQGGKSAQGGVIDLAHNPNPPHTRQSIPAGPQNAPARPPEQGHDLSHMNLSANSSSASLVSSMEKALPPLPPEVSGHGSVASSESSPHGTVPWLNDSSAPTSIKPLAASGSMIPADLLRADGGASGAGTRGSILPGETRRVDAFWNGLDRHIDTRLGPGDNHDMQDLLRATDNPMYRLILNRHPAVGGMPGEGGRALPPEFRNAPRHDRLASTGGESVLEDRAMWRDMRRQEADRKLMGGEGHILP